MDVYFRCYHAKVHIFLTISFTIQKVFRKFNTSVRVLK